LENGMADSHDAVLGPTPQIGLSVTNAPTLQTEPEYPMKLKPSFVVVELATQHTHPLGRALITPLMQYCAVAP